MLHGVDVGKFILLLYRNNKRNYTHYICYVSEIAFWTRHLRNLGDLRQEVQLLKKPDTMILKFHQERLYRMMFPSREEWCSSELILKTDPVYGTRTRYKISKGVGIESKTKIRARGAQTFSYVPIAKPLWHYYLIWKCGMNVTQLATKNMVSVMSIAVYTQITKEIACRMNWQSETLTCTSLDQNIASALQSTG